MIKVEWLQNSYFLLLCRLLLGGIFCQSSIGKIENLQYFKTIVISYHVIPKIAIKPFAFLLHWIEFFTGIMLVLGWETHSIGAITILLLLAFIFALYINLVRGQNQLECGCSGSARPHKISYQLIIRNMFYSLVSIPLIIWGGGSFALDSQSVNLNFIHSTLILSYLSPFILSGLGLYFCGRVVQQFLRLARIISQEEMA